MRANKSRRSGARASGKPSAVERRRTRLVEAAGEVFAELGYHDATIRKICERAGVNIAAVNYHFRDKSGLYTEVVRQSMRVEQLESVRAALNQTATPEEILRAVIKARLQSLSGMDLGDWHFRIMAHELAKPTPAINQVVNEAIRPIFQRLREEIGKILGLPRDDQKTRLCAHSIIGQILFYAFARPVIARLWPDLKMTPEQVNLIANHIADFSLAYLRTATAPLASRTQPKNGRKRK
jgi:AcrR family transcriptional regulator